MLSRLETCHVSLLRRQCRNYSAKAGWTSDLYNEEDSTNSSVFRGIDYNIEYKPLNGKTTYPFSKISKNIWRKNRILHTKYPLNSPQLNDEATRKPITIKGFRKHGFPLLMRGWDLARTTCRSPKKLHSGPAMYNMFYLHDKALQIKFTAEVVRLLRRRNSNSEILYVLEASSTGAVRLNLTSQRIPHPTRGSIISISPATFAVANEVQSLYESRYVPLQGGAYPWKNPTHISINDLNAVSHKIDKLIRPSVASPTDHYEQSQFKDLPSIVDGEYLYRKYLDDEHIPPLQTLYARGWKLFKSNSIFVSFGDEGRMNTLRYPIHPLMKIFSAPRHNHPSLTVFTDQLLALLAAPQPKSPSQSSSDAPETETSWQVSITPWRVKTMLFSTPLIDPHTQTISQLPIPTVSPSDIRIAMAIENLTKSLDQLMVEPGDPAYQPTSLDAIQYLIEHSFGVTDPGSPSKTEVLQTLNYVLDALGRSSSSSSSSRGGMFPFDSGERKIDYNRRGVQAFLKALPRSAEVSLFRNPSLLEGLDVEPSDQVKPYRP